MTKIPVAFCISAGIALAAGPASLSIAPAWAQEVASTSTDAAAVEAPVGPAALSEEDLEILVSRIALYPDDLVAVISAASLFPVQIIEAQRFLDARKADTALQPKDSWDGSVISLLNYPEIVKMMSDDLEWTQNLGTALTYQQKDVLVAIQQLREEAVAKDIIETDDKITVTEEDDNVIISSTNEEQVYIPIYEPEMLYVDDYPPQSISYYEDYYPYYYSPAAPFFAGFVTGAFWGAMVDWGDWGVWGGNWGGDIDIDCNRCLNDINGKVNLGDLGDLRNVDRSKISVDRSQFTGAKRAEARDNIKRGEGNNVRDRAAGVGRDGTAASNRAANISDVRKGAERPGGGEGLSRAAGAAAAGAAGAVSVGAIKQGLASTGGGKAKAAAAAKGGGAKAKAAKRAGKAKPAARADGRPKNPGALGEVRSGKKAQVHSSKGRQAAASRSGGSRSSMSRSSGSRSSMSRSGGSRSMSRGGGGRGGGGGGGGRGGRR